MKKLNCLLLILFIACCAVARAQTPAPTQAQAQAPAPAQPPPGQQAQPHHPMPAFHRWSFNLLDGPAYPVGQFAQTDESNPKSGPVHTGSFFEISSTYHLNQSWGITLLANHLHHTSEVDELIAPYTLVPDVSVPGPLNYSSGWDIKSPILSIGA